MKLKSHLLQGIVLSPIAYYLTDLKSVTIFLISFIFIDVDHYFLYIYRNKNLGIDKMFRYFDYMWENRKNIYEICIFHTVEFLLVLFILGYWRREFWVILAAFFIHLLFDIYYLYKHGAVFTRAFSVIEYFIHSRPAKSRAKRGENRPHCFALRSKAVRADKQWPLSIPPKERRASARVGSIRKGNSK